MPVKTSFLERIAFYRLNAAPGPMLDLVGALSYQATSTAVHLGLFDELMKGPRLAPDLAQALEADERGVLRLLDALEATGYVEEKDGLYSASAMTRKWFSEDAGIDLVAGTSVWDVYLRELWPHAPEIIKSGERPWDFYDYVAADPALSHNFQQLMVGNANVTGPDIIDKIPAMQDGARLLDVGGGHGAFTIQFCQTYPNLQATIIDNEAALATARMHVDEAGLGERITLRAADLWQEDWGGPYDLVLLFNLLHHFDVETNEKLLVKARESLKQGGRAAVLEQVEEQVAGSATNAIVRLMALLYHVFADGRVFSREQFEEMLGNSGFSDVRFHKLTKAPGNALITAVAD